MRGRDFVGRNVVAKLGIVRRILRVPGQIFARKLTLDKLRIFSEKKDATLKPDFVRTLFNLAFQK